MIKRLLCVASITLAVGVPATSVMAHGGATGVVKERMDLMKEMKTSMKELSSMFKGKTTYDPALVKQASEVLQAISGEKLTRLFPEGSLHKPSEAKAEIWSEWKRFQTMADDLNIYSAALAEAAGNLTEDSMDTPNDMMGGDMMGSASDMMGGGESMMALGDMPAERVFQLVVDTCSSCHTKFRIEKE